MRSPFIARCTRWLGHFVQLQLFMTLVCLPVLICWGLPFSWLSPLGNLLFSPVLFVYLLLLTLLFFAVLLGLPTSLLSYCIETITNAWLTLLTFPSRNWLVGFAQPPFWLLILIPVATLLVIHHKKTQTVGRRITCFMLIFACTYTTLHWLQKKNGTLFTIPCTSGMAHGIAVDNTLIIIEPGYAAQRASATSWMHYTLPSEIIKATGHTQIDHLIIMQPGVFIFQALENLCARVTVKTIWIPIWRGNLSKSAHRTFMQLRKTAREHATIIQRYDGTQRVMHSSPKATLTIENTSQEIKHAGAVIPDSCITACIDNKVISFYAAKHTNKKKHITI